MAGAVSLSVKEVDLQETLTLLAERYGHVPPDPAAPFPPWLPDEHPLSEVLTRRCVIHIRNHPLLCVTHIISSCDCDVSNVSQQLTGILVHRTHSASSCTGLLTVELCRLMLYCQIETLLRHGGTCKRCGALARLLVVTPCAHLLCIDCARTSRCASSHGTGTPGSDGGGTGAPLVLLRGSTALSQVGCDQRMII